MSKRQANPSINPPDSIARLLNICADEFLNASDAHLKRKALQDYLESLRMTLGAYQTEMLGDAVSPFSLARPGYFNLRPLWELEANLLELDNGETPDLFVPKKNAGRPPARRSSQMWLAAAASTMTTLMRRFNRTEDAAAKLVVQQMKIRGIPLPGSARTGRPAWKQLQSWRDDLLRGKKSRLARAYYDWDQLADSVNATETELFNSTLNPARLPLRPIGL